MGSRLCLLRLLCLLCPAVPCCALLPHPGNARCPHTGTCRCRLERRGPALPHLAPGHLEVQAADQVVAHAPQAAGGRGVGMAGGKSVHLHQPCDASSRQLALDPLPLTGSAPPLHWPVAATEAQGAHDISPQPSAPPALGASRLVGWRQGAGIGGRQHSALGARSGGLGAHVSWAHNLGRQGVGQVGRRMCGCAEVQQCGTSAAASTAGNANLRL